MTGQKPSLRARIGHNLRNRVFTGLLVLVPIGVTFLILRVIFHTTAGVLAPLITRALGNVPPPTVDVISICALVVLLYLVGAVAAHWVGRRLIAVGEAIITRIPIVTTVYSAAKQIVETFSLTQRKTFKSVVLVEFPRAGFYSLGFVTGTIQDRDGLPLYKVLILNAPNPATGFLEFVPADQVQETDLSVEDAIKMVVSCGILSPEQLGGGRTPEATGDAEEPA